MGRKNAVAYGLAYAAALLLLALPSAAAGQSYRAECNTAFCGGVSEDGSRAVFPFAEELTRGAERTQIYERSRGVTRPLVPYPDDAPNPSYTVLMGISADARHVFVHTALALVPEDRDGNTQDIYDISGGTATLLSTGPLDPQTSINDGLGAPFMMLFKGTSADGERVFLDSLFEPVVPEDTDRCPDVYERSRGQIKLISTGPTATQSYPSPMCDLAAFQGVSVDGSHVFFSTYDHLIPEDDDGVDIYQRVGDTLGIVTTYPPVAETCVDVPEFGDASADGRTVLFASNMPISPADTDSTMDVYRREPDGTFTLVSRGTEGGAGVGGCNPYYGDKAVALSADGRTAIFETRSRLSGEDRDSSPDLYSTSDSGQMSLVTTGPADPNLDEQILVPPAWPADFSDDVTHIAFESRQALVAGDTDDSVDVYLRAGGQTELVSTGPTGGNAAANAELLSISGDGQTVAFATKERLTELDSDGKMDFYLRRTGQLSRPGSASTSKQRRVRRTVLISAESIAPRMRVTANGRLFGSRRAAVRLGCPKAEKSGPCHGALRLAGGRAKGRAGFQVPAGKSKWIMVPLRRSPPPPGGRSLAFGCAGWTGLATGRTWPGALPSCGTELYRGAPRSSRTTIVRPSARR